MILYLNIEDKSPYNDELGRLHVWLEDFYSPGGPVKCEIFKDNVFTSLYKKEVRPELFVLSCLRTALSVVEAEMYGRLSSGAEKLSFEPVQREKDLRVPALTPCRSRQ